MIFQVEENDVGKRLDIFLHEKFSNLSRSHIKNMIDGGNVLLNGKVVKAGEKLRLNGVVQAEKPVLQEVKTKPEDIPIEIVYEDDDLAVVNKPGHGCSCWGRKHFRNSCKRASLQA